MCSYSSLPTWIPLSGPNLNWLLPSIELRSCYHFLSCLRDEFHNYVHAFNARRSMPGCYHSCSNPPYFVHRISLAMMEHVQFRVHVLFYLLPIVSW